MPCLQIHFRYLTYSLQSDLCDFQNIIVSRFSGLTASAESPVTTSKNICFLGGAVSHQGDKTIICIDQALNKRCFFLIPPQRLNGMGSEIRHGVDIKLYFKNHIIVFDRKELSNIWINS